MIVLLPHSLLANQMYQYAVAKSLSIDKNEELKIIIPKRIHKAKDSDNKLGSNLWTAFENIKKSGELVEDNEVDTYLSSATSIITDNGISYESCIKNDKNTFYKGCFLWHPDDFMHNLSEIRRCFSLPEEIKKGSQNKILAIKEKYNNRPIIATHFRVGWDYFREGRVLSYEYWDKAATQALKDYSAPPVFALLYDEKNSYIKRFERKYDTVDVRDSLFRDLTFISLADGLIVGNSTFGTWGGILNEKEGFKGYRPSIYPIDRGRCDTNTSFPSEWKTIIAKSNKYSRLFGFFYQNIYQLPIRHISHIAKKIIRYRNY